jgi:hypothetical protein
LFYAAAVWPATAMLFGKTSQWKLALDIGAVKTIARSIARAFAFFNFSFHIYRKGSCAPEMCLVSFYNGRHMPKQLGRLAKPLPIAMILPRQQSGSQPFKCVLEGSSTVSTMTIVLWSGC